MTNAPIASSTAVDTANRRTSRGGRCTPDGSPRGFLSLRKRALRLALAAAGGDCTYFPPLPLPLPLPFPLPLPLLPLPGGAPPPSGGGSPVPADGGAELESSGGGEASPDVSSGGGSVGTVLSRLLPESVG